jgi:hypothetical protein
MTYGRVKNREISIIMEDAKRCDKIVVWGCFYGRGGKDFERYFENIEKASAYYNKQLNKGIEKYLVKCKMIIA